MLDGNRAKLQIVSNFTKYKHLRKPESLMMHEGACLIKDNNPHNCLFYSVHCQRIQFKKGMSGYKITA